MNNTRAKSICFVAFVFLSLAIANPVLSATHCVSTASELSTALSTATNNGEDDIIRVRQGTYNGNFIYASTEAFGVTIEGGYTDGCTSRVVDPTNTEIDANLNGTPLALSTPILQSNFSIEGLTIKNGNSSGSHTSGLYINTEAGDVRITNTIITNNKSEIGLYGLTIENARNILLENNLVTENGGEDGNAIRINSRNSPNVKLINNEISDNVGNGFLVMVTGSVEVTNNIILNNGTFGIGGGGGAGISADTILFDRNYITKNESWNGGGVAIQGINDTYTAVFSNNTIIGNSAKAATGGALIGKISSGSKIVINNNVIAYNTCDRHGGLGINQYGPDHSTPSEINVINNTIYGNESLGLDGGGLYLTIEHDNTLAYIYNNIILENSAVNGDDLLIMNDHDNNFFPATVLAFNNNFDQSGGGTFIQIPFTIDPSNLNNIDPLFVDSDNDDYHLTADSPLIDKGNNSAPELPDKDKDGKPRIIDGDYDGISYVDIGAYEYGSPRGDLDGDGDVDGEDLRIFAESYGTYVGP